MDSSNREAYLHVLRDLLSGGFHAACMSTEADPAKVGILREYLTACLEACDALDKAHRVLQSNPGSILKATPSGFGVFVMGVPGGEA